MPVLEVIGGTAAVSQLLGQAITIVQKIQDARERVRGAINRLDERKGQLDNLLNLLRLVENEPELQTPPVKEQVQKIISLGNELQCQLDALAVQLAKSKTKQYTHAFTCGDKDERELENAMTQLDRAKADLNALILTTNVGLTGSIRAGFTVALAMVRKIDQNVQRVLDEGPFIATYLEEQRLTEEGNGTVPLTAEDVRALNRVDKVSWIDNEAFDDADMFNSDLVQRQNHESTKRVYQGNKAHGRSTIFQGHADAAGIAAILRAKRR